MSKVNFNKLRISNIAVVSSDYNLIISDQSEKQKIIASDRQTYDSFGYSVSINSAGDKCLVGAAREGTGGMYTGAAYIFNYNSSSGLWYEKQKIQASDKQTNDRFGNTVSVNSELLNNGNSITYKCLIGARLEDTGGGSAGAAYIFNYNSSSSLWYEKQKIQASDKAGDDRFGKSVSLNSTGNKCLIGAYLDNAGATNTGAAYIFNYNSSSGLWYEKQKIQASDRGNSDRFGHSVSISSELANSDITYKCLVSANRDKAGGFETGAAYIFNYNLSSGLWYQKQKIQASDRQANDRFGHSVSINSTGDKCLIGVCYEDTGGASAGAAYIFNYNLSSGLWYQKQKIQSSDIEADDRFGQSVSTNSAGDKSLIGARFESTGLPSAGAAYVFNYNTSSGLWYEKLKVQASDRQISASFGYSVNINSTGDKFLVGAIGESTAGTNTGAAYIFNASDITQVPATSGTVLYDNLLLGELYITQSDSRLRIRIN